MVLLFLNCEQQFYYPSLVLAHTGFAEVFESVTTMGRVHSLILSQVLQQDALW